VRRLVIHEVRVDELVRELIVAVRVDLFQAREEH
jgi:hypothetical protein